MLEHGGRRAAVVLAFAAVVIGTAGPVWAHGQVRPGRAAAGTTLDTVLVVPSERDGHGNARVALALPPEFTPRSCRAPVGWRCTTEDKGFTWDRVTGLVEATDFDLTMTVAATAGTYVLPLAQTYDDGETRTFAGGPGTRDEAPLFTVTGAGGASAAPSPTGATTVHSSRTPSRAATASASATGSGVPSTSPLPGATTAAPAVTAAGSSAPAPGGGLAALPEGRRLAPASSGGAPVVLIALGLVGLVVLGGLVLLVRRRPPAGR